MALKSMLGFGMMRLPVKSGPTDFDYETLNRMVDIFIGAGFNYFDTSYVYHQGKSQEAVRKAVVERYPREGLLIATKFPTFILETGRRGQDRGHFPEPAGRPGRGIRGLLPAAQFPDGVLRRLRRKGRRHKNRTSYRARPKSGRSRGRYGIWAFRSIPRQSCWTAS
jgi:hypothetical protein